MALEPPLKMTLFSILSPNHLFCRFVQLFCNLFVLYLPPSGPFFQYFFEHVFCVFFESPFWATFGDIWQLFEQFGASVPEYCPISPPSRTLPPLFSPAECFLYSHRSLACVQALSGTCTGKGPESTPMRQSTF